MLDTEIARLKARERVNGLARIKEIMDAYDLDVDDLTRTRRGNPGKVAVKYRHPASGETWTGRGIRPRWVQAALNSGAALEDFRV
jgi:DNA-binding protein H-NS